MAAGRRVIGDDDEEEDEDDGEGMYDLLSSDLRGGGGGGEGDGDEQHLGFP